ncbi:hypothetical protein BU15DRAFT_68718 [Melanogaster broomeanus]|nr:hypothetical protein BU15DRAFT_68718 [Melanogaster broomeanus]
MDPGALESANLHILNSRTQLKSHQFDDLDHWSPGEDKYVKTIEEKKRVLKEAKEERQEDVRMLAPLVEDATLDSQVEQLQKMEDKLQDLNSQIGATKQQLKTEMADLERLRGVERERIGELGLVEKEAGEVEDPRIGGLYDWYASCQLFILDGLFDEVPGIPNDPPLHPLKSSHAESENELRLTYYIDPLAASPSSSSKDLILTLLFIPNTRQLASADVSLGGVELDLGDVIDAHVQANDISGLIRTESRSRSVDRDLDQIW